MSTDLRSIVSVESSQNAWQYASIALEEQKLVKLETKLDKIAKKHNRRDK